MNVLIVLQYVAVIAVCLVVILVVLSLWFEVISDMFR